MLAALAIGLIALNGTFADDELPPPVPDHPAAEGTIVGPGVPTSGPIQLFACVKVEDEDNIHPCAVPMIVAVADPCNECSCRYVMICVPPADCCNDGPEIETSRSGRKVEYDYGEYEIEIKSKDDYVVINYDD
jgi:hypothetical protein